MCGHRVRQAYLDSLYLQLLGGVLVDDNHWVRMQLKTREGPHMVNAFFKALLQRKGFVRASDDDDNFVCLAEH